MVVCITDGGTMNDSAGVSWNEVISVMMFLFIFERSTSFEDVCRKYCTREGTETVTLRLVKPFRQNL